jgi:hypothetical protein
MVSNASCVNPLVMARSTALQLITFARNFGDGLKTVSSIGSLIFLCLASQAWAGPEDCSVCGDKIGKLTYFWEDKVAGGKKSVCEKCSALTTVCYLCGLPVKKDLTELPDGRILCARDAKSAVLDDDVAEKIIRDVKDGLDRLFSRFITFPETNVTIALVDRVNLQELFKFAGNDATCPNVWGYYQPKTNNHRFAHDIHLLSGLPRASLKATCAHEYTHAWMHENVSPQRQKSLNGNATEGFCELVSYLLMEAQREESQMSIIKSNAYTRGQIHLFLQAERRFGFNEIVEWIQYGEDDQLLADDLARIRRVAMPVRTNAAAANFSIQPAELPPEPDKLVLKGVKWSTTRPIAFINDRSFEAREEATVRVGKTNMTVRCLAIRKDSVVIQVVGSKEQQTLRLKTP